MNRYRYFILSAVILVADQVTKIIVNATIPLHTVTWNFGGDFFRLIHVRNKGAAFSLGSSYPNFLRIILLIVIPMFILGAIGVYLVRSKELSNAQRWVLAAILGGGLGNQIDRIFRSGGVVDFLDFKFYGIFGLVRWPTFNIADATLVVSAFALVFLLIQQEIHMRRS